MYQSKNICLNCGKYGHQLKACNEPVTSYGIMCFNLDSSLNINNQLIEQFFYNKFINIGEFNYANLDNIKLISDFYTKIKILMIRRKDSLNYIEFIRGKYNSKNKEELNNIFQLMTREENIRIRSNNFEKLWNDLWKKTAKSKIYQKEFNISKLKFEELKTNNFYNLLSDKNLSSYTEPEWGFPKGRKNYKEQNLNCAIREFYEETAIDLSNLYLLQRIDCVEEKYTGTNLIDYKHIYYLGLINNHVKLGIYSKNQYYEIGDIKWFTIPEAINKIRDYYKNKINILYQTYFFFINLITNIKMVNKMNN